MEDLKMKNEFNNKNVTRLKGSIKIAFKSSNDLSFDSLGSKGILMRHVPNPRFDPRPTP